MESNRLASTYNLPVYHFQLLIDQWTHLPAFFCYGKTGQQMQSLTRMMSNTYR